MLDAVSFNMCTIFNRGGRHLGVLLMSSTLLVVCLNHGFLSAFSGAHPYSFPPGQVWLRVASGSCLSYLKTELLWFLHT